MVSPDSPPSTAMSDVPSVTSSRLLHHPSSSPGSTIQPKIGSLPTLSSAMSNLSTTPLHNYCSYGPVYLFGNFFGNYTHNQPLCPSILYPNTSDPTTNVFRSYRTSSDPYRILPDKFGSCRLSVRRPLTRGQRAYIRRGGRSTNILFIPKR